MKNKENKIENVGDIEATETQAKPKEESKVKLAPNHFLVRNKADKTQYIQITEAAFNPLEEYWEKVTDEKEIEAGLKTLTGFAVSANYNTSGNCINC